MEKWGFDYFLILFTMRADVLEAKLNRKTCFLNFESKFLLNI